MERRRRQLLLAYRDSLIVAGFFSLFAGPFAARAGLWQAVVTVAIFAFVFGTGFFILHTVRDRIRIGSFGLNFVAQTALIALTIVVGSVVGVSAMLALVYNLNPFTQDSLNGMLKFWHGPLGLVLTLVGCILVAGIINAAFAVDRKMGPGVIWRWMTGKYYNPKEEERIFMFLDMRDSTAIAERIGNLKFSALVRDFFRDLTFPVIETKAEVSHYIGDEAVLTWRPTDGLRNANCLELFFKMSEAIEERRDYYLATYGFVPEFKAGLHIGQVVATEVGEVKSEIVYHGDVLNTAARIQSLCNEEGFPLLVSGALAERLGPLPEHLAWRSLGSRRLRGKEEELEIMAAELAPSG